MKKWVDGRGKYKEEKERVGRREIGKGVDEGKQEMVRIMSVSQLNIPGR
jgi:hypothetical protein